VFHVSICGAWSFVVSEGIKITLQRTYNAVNYRLG